MRAQPVDDERRLVADAHERSVQVADVDGRGRRPGSQRAGRELGELFGRHGPHELGQERRDVRLERRDAREPASLVSEPLGEHARELLVRAVLQEPDEEQVTRLEELEVVGVVDVPRRQEPGRLEVEQGRGDDEELARRVQVAVGGPQVGDELVRHLRESDLGDVELVLRDEREQEVERSGEVLEMDRELAV